MAVDVLQCLWLAGITGYLWMRHVRAATVVQAVQGVSDRHQRLERLKARRSDLEGLLTRMQSENPEERLAAAREAIRQRAAR